METNNLIKQFVMRDSRYTFSLEGGLYTFPVFLYSRDGNIINLKENREKSMKLANSSYSRKFKNDIIELRNEYKNSERRILSFSMEFPIIIENQELWNVLLSKQGVPRENTEFRNRRYFLLGFFFYYSGLAVEIDSDFHDRRKAYDRARDEYLKLMYGIETCRVNKYGESVVTERYDKEYVRDTVFQKTKNYSGFLIFPLDFSKTIIENYKIENKYTLDFISKLRKYLGELFEYYDNISITKKDLFCIDPYNFVAGLRKDQETLFLDAASMVLNKIYGKNLYIHETTEFSLGDVLRIVELISKRLFTWDDFSGKKVGKWIINLVGMPPLEYTNSSTPENLRVTLPAVDSSDGGVDIFLQTLEKSGIISPFWKPGNSY